MLDGLGAPSGLAAAGDVAAAVGAATTPLPEAAERAAQFIVSRGLATPAVLFLALHRPLAHLSSQAVMAGSGLLAPLFGLEGFRALYDTLSQPETFDAFLDRLETLSHKDAAAGPGAP